MFCLFLSLRRLSKIPRLFYYKKAQHASIATAHQGGRGKGDWGQFAKLSTGYRKGFVILTADYYCTPSLETN